MEMVRVRPWWLLAACLLLPALLWGKEAATPTRIPANNELKLRQSVGQTVAIYGKVNRATESRSGHHFLNFASSSVSVVCFKEDVKRFPKGGPAKLYRNRQVVVTGKLETYKGKLQIKLRQASQIGLDQQNGKPNSDPAGPATDNKKFSLSDVRVDGGAAGAEGKSASGGAGKDSGAKKFQLKQLGKTTWLSPAGVRYAGRDAEGRTRVEHVLRHAADQPRRAGSHGVFDGGNDAALALVDEAWTLIKKKRIKARNEGHTSTYLVPMGRRVGYLGGQNGARRRHPALTKVFIVVRTGTSEVITAFPR